MFKFRIWNKFNSLTKENVHIRPKSNDATSGIDYYMYTLKKDNVVQKKDIKANYLSI